MTSTITFRQPAPAGSRFAPGAFNLAIGAAVDVSGHRGILRSATVAADGMSVMLTVETADAGAILGRVLLRAARAG